jgi:predicted HNH restriction endonuclease
MPTYSESDLIIPALEIIAAHPEGITTTNLSKELRRRLRPTGDDLAPLANRQDDKFSQKVRNLKSHDTLEKKGFCISSNEKYKITREGREFLKDGLPTERALRAQGFTERQRQKALERNYRGIVFEEGALITTNRKVAQRSALLRKIAIKHFKDENDSIQCEGCGFRAEDVYGDEFRGLIEIHHARPLFVTGFRKIDRDTAIEQLIPLCPNCHRVVHRDPNTCISLSELRLVIDAAKPPSGEPTE